MLPAGDSEPGRMDGTEASVCNICEAALVGRVIRRDAFLSKGCIATTSEDSKNHSSLPYPLWAKAVYLIPYR